MSEELEQPGRDDLDLPTILAALADPARLAAVRALAQAGEASCGQIPHASGFGCSKSTLSHHLRVLREAGITRTRVAGTRRWVSLRRDDLDARFPGLLDAVLGGLGDNPERAPHAAAAAAANWERPSPAAEDGDRTPTAPSDPRQPRRHAVTSGRGSSTAWA